MNQAFEENLDNVLPFTFQRESRWPEPTMNFLVAYDIANPGRLAKVAKSLEQEARRVQKSVFIFTGTRRELEGVIRNLMAIIEPTTDRVQAWPIRTSTRACRMDAGNALPDTGVALVIADDQWTVIEAMDDDQSQEPLLLD